MQLNIFTQSSLLAAATAKAKVTILNTRFGSLNKVNEEYSKYSVYQGTKRVTLVKRIDLGELFGKIEQDVTDLEYTPDTPFVDITDKLGIDQLSSEGPFTEDVIITLEEGDELGKVFLTWTKFVGLAALYRHEVDLSTADGYLIIDAYNSLLFKGSVRVKYKKD